MGHAHTHAHTKLFLDYDRLSQAMPYTNNEADESLDGEENMLRRSLADA